MMGSKDPIASSLTRPGERMDAFYRGRLHLIQPERGYRFSVDSVLLAQYAGPAKGDRIVDLGTGCGVVALILAAHPAPSEIVGVEIQPLLADLAVRNVRLNGFEKRVRICCCDVRRIRERCAPERFDLAVANPPFGRPGRGRVNPDSSRAMARHEILGSLEDFVEAAAFLVRFGGRLVLVYRSSDLVRLFRCLDAGGFTPKRMRLVHGKRRYPARLVLISATKGGGEELRVDPPLIMYGEDGSMTPELTEMYHLDSLP